MVCGALCSKQNTTNNLVVKRGNYNLAGINLYNVNNQRNMNINANSINDSGSINTAEINGFLSNGLGGFNVFDTDVYTSNQTINNNLGVDNFAVNNMELENFGMNNFEYNPGVINQMSTNQNLIYDAVDNGVDYSGNGLSRNQFGVVNNYIGPSAVRTNVTEFETNSCGTWGYGNCPSRFGIYNTFPLNAGCNRNIQAVLNNRGRRTQIVTSEVDNVIN